MNATNRVANRIILFVGGLTFIVGGLLALAYGLLRTATLSDNPTFSDWLTRVNDFTKWLFDQRVQIPGMPSALLIAPAIAGTVAALALIILVVFFFTRGGGKTNLAQRFETPEGLISVDSAVAKGCLVDELSQIPGVASVAMRIITIKRQRAIRLSVRTDGTPLPALDALPGIIERWDALMGKEQPIVVLLEGRSVFTRLKAVRRVQ